MWKYLVKQGPGTRMDAAAAANAAEETSMAARQQALQKDRDGPPPSMFSPATRHQQEDDRAQQRAAGGDLPPLQSPLRVMSQRVCGLTKLLLLMFVCGTALALQLAAAPYRAVTVWDDTDFGMGPGSGVVAAAEPQHDQDHGKQQQPQGSGRFLGPSQSLTRRHTTSLALQGSLGQPAGATGCAPQDPAAGGPRRLYLYHPYTRPVYDAVNWAETAALAALLLTVYFALYLTYTGGSTMGLSVLIGVTNGLMMVALALLVLHLSSMAIMQERRLRQSTLQNYILMSAAAMAFPCCVLPDADDISAQNKKSDGASSRNLQPPPHGATSSGTSARGRLSAGTAAGSASSVSGRCGGGGVMGGISGGGWCTGLKSLLEDLKKEDSSSVASAPAGEHCWWQWGWKQWWRWGRRFKRKLKRYLHGLWLWLGLWLLGCVSQVVRCMGGLCQQLSGVTVLLLTCGNCCGRCDCRRCCCPQDTGQAERTASGAPPHVA